MKSNKIFLLFICLMLLILWIVDLVLETKSMRSIDGVEKIIIALMGIVIMRLTLEIKDFKVFCFLYGAVWVGFIFLKLISILIPVLHFTNHNIITMHIVRFYLFITFLNTPLPFILYWVFLKSINSINKK